MRLMKLMLLSPPFTSLGLFQVSGGCLASRSCGICFYQISRVNIFMLFFLERPSKIVKPKWKAPQKSGVLSYTHAPAAKGESHSILGCGIIKGGTRGRRVDAFGTCPSPGAENQAVVLSHHLQRTDVLRNLKIFF